MCSTKRGPGSITFINTLRVLHIDTVPRTIFMQYVMNTNLLTSFTLVLKQAAHHVHLLHVLRQWHDIFKNVVTFCPVTLDIMWQPVCQNEPKAPIFLEVLNQNTYMLCLRKLSALKYSLHWVHFSVTCIRSSYLGPRISYQGGRTVSSSNTFSDLVF